MHIILTFNTEYSISHKVHADRLGTARTTCRHNNLINMYQKAYHDIVRISEDSRKTRTVAMLER